MCDDRASGDRSPALARPSSVHVTEGPRPRIGEVAAAGSYSLLPHVEQRSARHPTSRRQALSTPSPASATSRLDLSRRPTNIAFGNTQARADHGPVASVHDGVLKEKRPGILILGAKTRHPQQPGYRARSWP